MFKQTFLKSLALLSVFISGMSHAQTKNLSEKLKTEVKKSPWQNKKVIPYVVPAMSSHKRLPDVIPPDGKISDQLTIIAAKGEFEPASFVLFSLNGIKKLTLKASGLKGQSGTIPASAVDIKVVKCWYQAGTAWNSYFADTTKRELVPELLLNDENLLKVDTKTKDNYLRIDYPKGSEYVWISYTEQNNPGPFDYRTEPVADSPKLLPVKMPPEAGKQFWITVKVPEKAKAGRYQGAISLIGDGKPLGRMNLNLQVLPFSLPEPKTYYDIDKTFYASMYNKCEIGLQMKHNGGDLKQASKKILTEYKNMHDHGCDYPLVAGWDNNPRKGVTRELFVRQLELLKKSGLKTKPLFGGVHIIDWTVMVQDPAKRKPDVFDKFKNRVDKAFDVVEEVLGHHDVYTIGWDEPGAKIMKGQRKAWKYIHDKAGRIMSTSKDKHLIYCGFNEDYSNYGGTFNATSARKWHAIGGKITSYASPHIGPENPAFMRRRHGMALYKADLDGTCNYIWYSSEGNPNIWNDFIGVQYRSFAMVYPTKDDVIDTIAWEGFREGIDDIRYATKLRQLAFKAIESGNTRSRYAGKLALQWLALLDENKIDLNTMRLEMINYILKIQKSLKGGA